MKTNNFLRFVSISIFIGLFHCASPRQEDINSPKLELRTTNNDTDYCAIIDTIIYRRLNKMPNGYMTKHLGVLSQKAGFSDRSSKGTAGCYYENDSEFYSDINRFKLALGCK